ncbi:MAG: alpha/beta hydrolase [bacterium]|nr:alpha/beta hydrolase [bacterium]
MKRFFTITGIILVVIIIVFFLLPSSVLFSIGKAYERGIAGLDEHTIKISDHSIMYLEGGTGEPLLLVHGYAADKDNWTRFAKHLTASFRVICPDLPGFGESTRNKNMKYDLKSQARRLNEITEKIGLKQFHIAGNSMGGNLTGYFASAYPEKVLSLALIDAGGVTSPVKSHFQINLAKGKNLLVASSVEDYDRLMRYVCVVPPDLPSAIKKYLAERAVEYRPFNEKIMKDLRAAPVPLEPLLDKISCPTLILWGDKDRVLDVSCVKVFEKGIKNHTTVIMKNCGHVPMIERPKEAAGHYRDFLNELI